MTGTDVVWLVLGVAVAAFEARGIIDPKPGNTISEYVWAVRRWKLWFLPIGSILVAVGMGWATFHFLVEG